MPFWILFGSSMVQFLRFALVPQAVDADAARVSGLSPVLSGRRPRGTSRTTVTRRWRKPWCCGACCGACFRCCWLLVLGRKSKSEKPWKEIFKHGESWHFAISSWPTVASSTNMSQHFKILNFKKQISRKDERCIISRKRTTFPMLKSTSNMF